MPRTYFYVGVHTLDVNDKKDWSDIETFHGYPVIYINDSDYIVALSNEIVGVEDVYEIRCPNTGLCGTLNPAKHWNSGPIATISTVS